MKINHNIFRNNSLLTVIGVTSFLLYFIGNPGLALLSSELSSQQFLIITPLIPLTPLGFLTNHFKGMTLVTSNLKKVYLRYHPVGLLVLVSPCFLFGTLFSIQGIILAILVTESLIFIVGANLVKCNIFNNQLLVHD